VIGTADIAPSLLAADFGAFAEAVRQCDEAGITTYHLDVMDGHFVPNLTYGPPLVRALRPRTRATFDVHLMVEKPDWMLEEFREAGADILTVHAEACTHLHRTLGRIRDLGARAGVALNPATPLCALDHVWDLLDLVLVMTVNPGFGGQSFLGTLLPKIEAAGRHIAQLDHPVTLEVDGGIGAANIRQVAEAGATLIVAGTSVFGHPGGVAAGVSALRSALDSP
jgi:ribulose-phosphate 3-epimerase